jgi:hypothetical protein
LEERLNGIEEVVSSNLIGSTNSQTPLDWQSAKNKIMTRTKPRKLLTKEPEVRFYR